MTPAQAPVLGHLLGDPGAPTRVIAYGTFECLHCRRAWPALRALAADAAAGVSVEWRHFAPGGAFPNAAAAARVAEATRELPNGGNREYWALHEALMAAPTPLWPERVDRIAAALNLDAARLRAAAAGDGARARVEAQRAAALADGVQGTPAAFLVGAGGGAVRLDLDDLAALPDQVAGARAAG